MYNNVILTSAIKSLMMESSKNFSVLRTCWFLIFLCMNRQMVLFFNFYNIIIYLLYNYILTMRVLLFHLALIYLKIPDRRDRNSYHF